jgi:hypothetical protein
LKTWVDGLPSVQAVFEHAEFPEKVKEKKRLGVCLLLIKFIRQLYKLAAIKNEAHLKPSILNTINLVWKKIGTLPLEETGTKNKLKISMLRSVVRLMRNRYDEMRFVLHKELLPSIFEYFSDCNPPEEEWVLSPKPTEAVPPADAQAPTDQKADQPPVDTGSQKGAQPDAAKEVQADKVSESPAVDPQTQPPPMSNSVTSEAILEPTFYLFYLVSRNQLLMDMDYKQRTFATVRARRGELLPTRFCQLIYDFLEREYANVEARAAENQAKASAIGRPEIDPSSPRKAQGILQAADDGLARSLKEFPDRNPPMSSKHILLDTVAPAPLKLGKDPLTVETASLRLKESSLSHKQKNILYIHKVLTTVHTNIDKNGGLTEREEGYLNFGLIALHKHLLENLDPELFNAFGFFGLVAALAIDDRLAVTHKRDCLLILRLFLATCRSKSSVQSSETTALVTFYERLLFDNYPEMASLYFEVLGLVFTHIPFPPEFLDEYMDKMSFCLFEAYSSIGESVFIPALGVFVSLLHSAHPKIDAQRVGNAVYAFVKINNKDMKLYERTLFILLLAYLEDTGAMDPIKVENTKHFIRYSHSMEGFDKTSQSLDGLVRLTEVHPNFQKLLRAVNFEAVYKAVFKHHSNDLQILQQVTRLFLRYTYKIEENKFEMFECIRLILRDIRRFYRQDGPENQAFVLLLYKSLVNASLHKANAEYLVKSDLAKVMVECVYHNDPECAVVLISLLFNICYIFEKEEFNVRKFVGDGLIGLLLELFDEALEARNDATICELIDLFVGFLQHQFTDFFSRTTVARVKLTLNLYYNSLEITIKFLNILRDITVCGSQSIKALVLAEFDYIYLYHVHYRNLRNVKVNLLVKHVIFNLVSFQGQSATEQELVTFGIPENVVHTFSLADPDPVMTLNLRIILLSLRFEKCLYFIRNNFMAPLRDILLAKPGRYKEDVIFYAMDILRELLAVFKDPQLLNASYYFDDLPSLFDLMMFCIDRDDYLVVLLKILKNCVDNDKDLLGEIGTPQKVFMQELISMKSKAKNRELLSLVYGLAAFVDIRESLMDDKLNITRNRKVSQDDRVLLEAGQSVVVHFRDRLHKNGLIRFNFVKNKFNLLNVDLTSNPKKTEKRKIGFGAARVDCIGMTGLESSEKVESIFRTYFMRNLRKELYFSFLLLDEDENGVSHETVFLIFENEFKCAKWRSLISILSAKN